MSRSSVPGKTSGPRRTVGVSAPQRLTLLYVMMTRGGSRVLFAALPTCSTHCRAWPSSRLGYWWDPRTGRMAFARCSRDSPLPRQPGMPGSSLLGFLAGASVVRRDVFLEAGGFEPRFFIGGEEELLAADLAARGHWLCYVPELVVHHHPSPVRDGQGRRLTTARNALWFTWLPALADRTGADAQVCFESKR